MASNGHEATMDSTMDGLIRRSLSTANAAAQNCPDPEIVASYYERELDPNDRARFETHLSNCARCREQLAVMVRADEKPASAVRHTWLWDWRWLAPAVAALLILTLWGVHRSTSLPGRLANGKQPLVAMSRPPQPTQPEVLPLGQSPAESPTSAQTLIAPKSTDHISSQLQTQQQAKAPQMDHTSQTLQAEKQSLSLNSRASADQNEPKVAQKPSDESNAVANLKKAVGNAAAAPAAGSPPAVPQPKAADQPSAAPRDSLDTSASNQSIASTNAAEDAASENGTLGGALGAMQAQPRLKAFAAGAVAQATEQRSGSTIIPTPDPKILWRIAGGNFVERTEDGGATWRGQVADPDAQLTAGSAPTNKTCWLVGKAGVIVVTKDSKQWKKLPPPVPADFVRVEAKNSSSATVTAADGQKFSTENEGKKWVPAK
jgi:hypothetical protein